jgi:hypothetical protein
LVEGVQTDERTYPHGVMNMKKNRGACCSHRTRTRPFRESAHGSACDHSARRAVQSLKTREQASKAYNNLGQEHSKRSTRLVSMCCADSVMHMQMQWCHVACGAHACAVTRERMTGLGVREMSVGAASACAICCSRDG